MTDAQNSSAPPHDADVAEPQAAEGRGPNRTESPGSQSARQGSARSKEGAPAGDSRASEAPAGGPVGGTADESANGSASDGAPTAGVGELEDVWVTLKETIRKKLAPEQFETWFRRSALIGCEDGRVELAVQNKFAKDWLETYYLDVIVAATQTVFGRRMDVRITVDPELAVGEAARESRAISEDDGAGAGATAEAPAGSTRGTSDRRPAAARDASTRGASRADDEDPAPRRPGGLMLNSDIVLNANYTFDNYVVGPCNRFGHAAALGAAEQPGKVYNPYFLHGNVGVGKTHLLQGICYLILERFPDSRILYLSCETFVNHFISALENGDLDSFRNKYRNVDVLVVDDIHLLANKERTQEEFFHTFNTLYNAEKQIVLSSDSPPKDIPTLQDRLVSRFKWGMVTEIEPPCYETRVAIVKRKSRNRGQEFPDDVTQVIAEHVTDNVRELEGAVTRLLAFSNLTSQPVTLELAHQALADVFTVRRGEPTMEDITSLVTGHYGVKLSDLQSKKRTATITWPRQVAMFLARRVTRQSLEEVGAYFGGRDHSTVLYGVEKVKRRIAEEEHVLSELDGLLTRLSGKGLAG